MTNDEQNALRALLREEVNAAVYASEQRIGERLDRLEGGQKELQLQVSSLGIRMDHQESRQRDLQFQVSKIEITLTEAISILDMATKVNNDLQASQRAIEIRLEDNIIGLRREMQKLTDTVQRFAEHFIALNHATNDRITLHEKAPLNATHPYPPHSAV